MALKAPQMTFVPPAEMAYRVVFDPAILSEAADDRTSSGAL